jgi:hypothetical protein
MLVRCGRKWFNTDAIETGEESNGNLRLNFSLGSFHTFKGDEAKAVIEALSQMDTGRTFKDVTPRSVIAEQASAEGVAHTRHDAAQQVLVAAPVAGVVEGTLNT